MCEHVQAEMSEDEGHSEDNDDDDDDEQEELLVSCCALEWNLHMSLQHHPNRDYVGCVSQP